MQKRSICLALGGLLIVAGAGRGAAPELILGPKASIGLFQPRVTVEVFADPEGQQSLGPSTASSFLLDTGANGTIVFSTAAQLKSAGYTVEGTFEESGVSGVETFDVSAPYRVNYTGTDGIDQFIPDARLLSSNTGEVDPTGLLNLYGILGMQAMEGRVTTMDNVDTSGALTLSTGLSFSETLPSSATQRFTVPLTELAFPFEGDGPIPTSASLSTLGVMSVAGDRTRTDQLVLDTGAQMTIISERMAFDLNLDANGNGDLTDDASSFVPIGGVGGTIEAPVLRVDELRVKTDQGYELSWQDADVIVLDIHPRIEGVLGADMLTGDGGLDVGALSGGGGSGLDDLFGDLLGSEFGDLFGDLFGDVLGDGSLQDVLELFGDLGGLGDLFGGGGGLFDGLPLESHFDRVHFDFRDFAGGTGSMVLDVNPQISAGILNGDGVFDARDIDDLTAALDSFAPAFDLDGDGVVGATDRDLLISAVFHTTAGDGNLDERVDFGDFLTLSQNYNQPGGWGDGDYNGDGLVDFGDFLALSENFGGAPPVAASVPEPTAAWLWLTGLALVSVLRRR